MATKKTGGSTSTAKRTTVRRMIGEPGGQQRVARELANQRRALGAAGAERAMRNWGIRAVTPADRKAGTAARGQKFTRGGRNG